MERETIRVLLVEDDQDDAFLLQSFLAQAVEARFELVHAERFEEALHRLDAEAFDVVLLDLSLPDAWGLDTLVRMQEKASWMPIIVLTGFDDRTLALGAMRAGAQDYLVKGQINAPLLERSARYAIERKQGAEALRQSEEYFRSLIENALDVITIITADGTIRFESPSVYRVLGYRPDELIGRNAFELIHPDDLARTMGVLAEALAQPREPKQVELRFRHKNGSWRSLEIVGQNLLDDPLVRGLVINSRDVTDRREAEAEVRHLKAFYEQVLNDLPVDLGVMGPDGRILFVNQRAVADPEIRAWMVGRTSLDYCLLRGIDPEIGHRRQRVIEQVVAGAQQIQFEETLVTRSGDTRHILRVASPVLGPEGNVARVLGYGLDITDRIRAEEALRASEERLRTVIASAPLILFALDRQGIFTLSEGKGLESLEARPGEVIGRSVFAVYRDVPQVLADARRALAGEAVTSTVTVNGMAFECWYTPVRDEQGEVDQVIGVAIDVTELRRSAQKLRRSRKQLRDLAAHLQSVREEERTRIAREIHDVLGQALTILKIDAAWLTRRLGDGPGHAPLLKKTRSMAGLIDATIQAVRKISSELRPGILDDLGLVDALDWQAHEYQARTGIKCRFTPPAERIRLDPDRSTAFFRIFQEILTNVARHAGARRVVSTFGQENGNWMLQVRDDGRGIREGEITGTRSFGLLGMRERVIPWGGEVQIEGRPGEGTTVTVRIPVQDEDARVAVFSDVSASEPGMD